MFRVVGKNRGIFGGWPELNWNTSTLHCGSQIRRFPDLRSFCFQIHQSCSSLSLSLPNPSSTLSCIPNRPFCLPHPQIYLFIESKSLLLSKVQSVFKDRLTTPPMKQCHQAQCNVLRIVETAENDEALLFKSLERQSQTLESPFQVGRAAYILNLMWHK